jgi:hypothetical protein
VRPDQSVRPATAIDSEVGSGAGSTVFAAPKNNDPPEIRHFKDTIREAEKSTLIFNLDMGRVPLLNSETISKRATLALTTMAAKVDKSNTSIPNQDSISAIDDVLSVTKGMSFFGKATKTYNNAKDSASGSFCTVPVKYDFKDRETRIQAEAILRKTCNINCATPYPPILRECIKQTTAYFRTKTESEFVRVSVDIAKLALRAQTKRNKDDRWIWIDESIRIPHSVITHSSRRVPLGFKMEFIRTDERATGDPAAMETDAAAELGAAALSPTKRQSRINSTRNASPLKAV